MKKLFKNKVRLLFALITACTLLTSCGFVEFLLEDDYSESDLGDVSVPTINEIMANNETETGRQWALYVYMSGTDLETENGYATDDLMEIISVDLPDDVVVILQTGGTEYWHNDFVNPDYIQRFIYQDGSFTLLEELPLSSMGSEDTFASFLDFAYTNYPADDIMLNFWNHGGGSVGGVCEDELFDSDTLTVDEIESAMTSIFPKNPDNPPLSIVSFDACIMATIDVASALHGHSEYMVASQENILQDGFYYTGFMQDLADNTSISPKDLSLSISEHFQEEYLRLGYWDELTISVTDLDLVDELVSAFDNFGKEVFAATLDDPGNYTRFSNTALSTENYGGNTESEGFYNMLDIGHIARQNVDVYPSAQALLDALDEAVIYENSGVYRSEATGLSFFYSLDKYIPEIYSFEEISASPAFAYLYRHTVANDLDDAGLDYISDLGYDFESEEDVPDLITVFDMGWDNHPLYVDQDGFAVLELGRQVRSVLDEVTFKFSYYDYDNNLFVNLGTDNDLIADWNSGVFRDNFRGVWGSIDGALCYIELAYFGDDYNVYSVPVLINGEEFNLSVVYNFTYEEWIIEGATPDSNHGIPAKELYQLQPGDHVSPILYASELHGFNKETFEISVDTIIVDENTSFFETKLSDGIYRLIFEMHDSSGNIARSQPANFEVDGKDIYSSLG